MSPILALRPTYLFNRGDEYFPEGDPKDDDSEIIRYGNYRDENGGNFSIVYTKTQLNKHIKDNMGICMPYLPLFICRELK